MSGDPSTSLLLEQLLDALQTVMVIDASTVVADIAVDGILRAVTCKERVGPAAASHEVMAWPSPKLIGAGPTEAVRMPQT